MKIARWGIGGGAPIARLLSTHPPILLGQRVTRPKLAIPSSRSPLCRIRIGLQLLTLHGARGVLIRSQQLCAHACAVRRCDSPNNALLTVWAGFHGRFAGLGMHYLALPIERIRTFGLSGHVGTMPKWQANMMERTAPLLNIAPLWRDAFLVPRNFTPSGSAVALVFI